MNPYRHEVLNGEAEEQNQQKQQQGNTFKEPYSGKKSVNFLSTGGDNGVGKVVYHNHTTNNNRYDVESDGDDENELFLSSHRNTSSSYRPRNDTLCISVSEEDDKNDLLSLGHERQQLQQQQQQQQQQ